MAQSYVDSLESKTSKEHEWQIEECKVGAGDWLVPSFELNKDFTFENYQLHQRVGQNHLEPTKVMDGALNERARQRDHVYQTNSPITAQSWSYVPSQPWQSRWQDHWWEYTQDSWD